MLSHCMDCPHTDDILVRNADKMMQQIILQVNFLQDWGFV